ARGRPPLRTEGIRTAGWVLAAEPPAPDRHGPARSAGRRRGPAAGAALPRPPRRERAGRLGATSRHGARDRSGPLRPGRAQPRGVPAHLAGSRRRPTPAPARATAPAGRRAAPRAGGVGATSGWRRNPPEPAAEAARGRQGRLG